MTSDIARRIRELRTRLGWSAQRLADECVRVSAMTVTRSTIAKIECGVRRTVSVHEAESIAQALGVSLIELASGAQARCSRPEDPWTDWIADNTARAVASVGDPPADAHHGDRLTQRCVELERRLATCVQIIYTLSAENRALRDQVTGGTRTAIPPHADRRSGSASE